LESNQTNNETPSGSVDLKNILDFLGHIRHEVLLKANLKRIAIVMFLTASVFLLFSLFQPELYRAEASFIADDNSKSAGMGSMINIASQLGLGGGGLRDNTGKLLELLKSRRILETALLDTAVIEGRKDLIIHFYLELTDQGKEIREISDFADVQFTSDSVPSRRNQAILSMIMGEYLKNILETDAKKGNAIVKIKIRTIHEELSRVFCESLIKALNTYYISTTTQQQQQMFDILKFRADSLKSEIENTEFDMAASTDRNMLSPKMEQRIDAVRLKREVTVLNILYTEVIKNVEMARFSLLNETPVLNVIDAPVYPLPKEMYSPKIFTFWGLCTGLFLGICMVLISALYRFLLYGNA